MLEAGLDVVQHVLKVLAAQGADVLGGSLLGVGDENVDELAGNSLQADLVVVALRERRGALRAGDDLNGGVAAEASRVERVVLERQVRNLEIRLDGVGDLNGAVASSFKLACI